MRHRVREVEEEGLILVAIDERDGALGVEAGQPALVFGRDFGIDDPGLPRSRERRIVARLRLRVGWPHVVGIGKAEVFVKPVVNRQEPGMMAEVPLAGHAGGVSLPLEELGEGRLAVGDPVLGLGPEGAVDADPVGVAAGEQGRARGRTDRLGDVEIGEPPPFAGEPVEVRRLESPWRRSSRRRRILDRR